MIVYSACRDCGGLLHITNPNDTVHPNCQPKPTKVERLTQQWLTAIHNNDSPLADSIEATITEIENKPPRLLHAALHYATQYNWPVFPLKAHEKRPATRNGFKDATTDPDRITAWWTRHPHSNIGLPTGQAFDIIDIDTPINIPALQQLWNTDLNIHGQVCTSSGGIHYYVKPTGRGNTARSMPNIDYRGRGGYVVAPPSTLGQPGRTWTWTHRPSPAITAHGDTYGR